MIDETDVDSEPTPPTGASELDSADEALIRAVVGSTERPPPAAVGIGQVIDGSFRITRRLGAGGMGVVYLARDVELRRDVAIKLHASAVNAERLRREATAIAQLNHPNVVTLYRVGVHAGHPFVAMEYVPGGTARTWRQAASRTWREIVEVYRAAGLGLAAAHAAGLVHRDFKPDNVLVGDDGKVRVADFGLAREIDASESAPPDGEALPLTALTVTGTVMGTPAYMAPEQRAGDEIGPAADQFAFCVALWEALGGERPAAGQPAPDHRIPRHLRAPLRRGLSADPGARFPSMRALLAALDRPPLSRYRGAALGVAAAAAAGLAAFLITPAGADPTARCLSGGDLAWPARRHDVEQAFTAVASTRAPAAFDEVAAHLDGWSRDWREQRVVACRATHATGEQTVDTLELRTHCLRRAAGELTALVDALAAADAGVVAHAAGAAYALPDLAPCADVAALRGEAPRPADPAKRAALDALETELDALAVAYHTGRLDDGFAAATALVPRAEALGHAPVRAEAYRYLGLFQGARGDVASAERSLRAGAMAAAEGRRDRDAALLWIGLLALLTYGGDLDAAQQVAHMVDAAVARVDPEPELEARRLSALGQLETALYRFDEARDLLERALAIYEEDPGPDDAEVAHTLTALGTVASFSGRPAEAIPLLERALAISERVSGAQHASVLATLYPLASALDDLGRDAEAQVHVERALAIVPDSPPLHELMGMLRADQGDADGARRHLDRAVALRTATEGPDSVDLVSALVALGNLAQEGGDLESAYGYAAHALGILDARSPDDPVRSSVIYNLANAAVGLGRLDEAGRLYRRALELREATLGPSDPALVAPLAGVAAIELQAGRPGEALALLRRALAIREAELGADHPDLAMLHAGISEALTALGRVEEANASRARAVELLR